VSDDTWEKANQRLGKTASLWKTMRRKGIDDIAAYRTCGWWGSNSVAAWMTAFFLWELMGEMGGMGWEL